VNAPETLAALRAGAEQGRVLSRAELAAWGRALGRMLPHGTVLALHGDLGAGKTTLVRALAEGLGVCAPEEVVSPTYAIVHEHATATGVLLHADLYRLHDPRELEQLGWDEALGAARAAVVEWPERAPSALPREAWHLQLAHVPDRPDVRALRLAPSR
jgi:tRNA threonylcarbamoyl adenosine modification protein YjeE